MSKGMRLRVVSLNKIEVRYVKNAQKTVFRNSGPRHKGVH